MKTRKDGVHTLQLVLRRPWHSFALRLLLMTSYVAWNFCSKCSVLTVMIIEGSLAGSLLKKVSFSYTKGQIVSGNARVPQIIKWPTHLQKSEALASSLKLSILWTWTSWLESHADYNTCQSGVKKSVKIDSLTIVALRTQIPLNL